MFLRQRKGTGLAKQSSLKSLPRSLLDWFEVYARELPWRVMPAQRALGVRPDPYAVWLCEIMMQQTTIPHGTPYYHAFLTRWPTVEALATAKDEEVMTAWAGLGYYARARNLLKCAREVSALGAFPETEAALQKLPGIGPYTAGAIAALVFDAPGAAAVDGNVERVMARVLAVEGEWTTAKKEIAGIVRRLVPDDRPGEFAEAFMDLGATICMPRNPACGRCPIAGLCRARKAGEQERYPIKAKKAALPVRKGVVFIAENKGAVLLERRPEKGLLGGMLGLPTSEWVVDGPVEAVPPRGGDWQSIGAVRHVFTHFALELDVHVAVVPARMKGHWVKSKDVEGLPTVFKKAFVLWQKQI